MTYILFKMADDHMENQNYKDVIPRSEDESEVESENNPTDSDLREVVNEHNEVLGVVQNPTNFANLSEGRSEESYDYDPPPVPENMFSSSESSIWQWSKLEFKKYRCNRKLLTPSSIDRRSRLILIISPCKSIVLHEESDTCHKKVTV